MVRVKTLWQKRKLGAWEYDIIGPWYKCNMTDVCAGIGLGQIKGMMRFCPVEKKL